MRLSIAQYAQALLELEREGNPQEIGQRFFAWLLRRGEGAKFPNIIAEAERMARVRSGITDVTITTAREADAATRETLKSQAETVLDGKKIEAKFAVDPTLIGGARIRSNETLYDASIMTAVRALKKNLEL